MKRRVKDISNGKRSENMRNEKKPFDKKKYRLQKYSNKYKINQWEERRKKAILRSFYKELDKEQQQKLKLPSASQVGNQDENKQKKISAFHKAKEEFLHKIDEERKQKEEAIRIKEEKEEARKKNKKRIELYKKLAKKTMKGQPVMKDRLEMLLEKIQQMML